VKRLLVLLVLLAAGVAAAALAVPTNAATVNGATISQQQLNTDVTAIAASPYYQCYANSLAYLQSGGTAELPPVDGAGQGELGAGQHPTATTEFVASYLDTAIAHLVIMQLAEDRGVVATPEQVSAAHGAYSQQITSVMEEMQQTGEAENPSFTCGGGLSGPEVLSTLPSSFVDDQVQFLATVDVLQEDLSGVGSSDAALQAYYDRHRSEFDTVCITAALYASESDATAALAQAQTTPFAQVASQATEGGPQGCDVLADFAERLGLPTSFKLDQLATGTVSFPVALSDGEYLLLQITSRTPTPYAKAEPYVVDAVLQAGAAPAQRVIEAAERRAEVSVDPRYGVWVPVRAQVLVPFTPAPSDVPNAAANTASY